MRLQKQRLGSPTICSTHKSSLPHGPAKDERDGMLLYDGTHARPPLNPKNAIVPKLKRYGLWFRVQKKKPVTQRRKVQSAVVHASAVILENHSMWDNPTTQWVQVLIKYIRKPKRKNIGTTARPRYTPCSYMDPLGYNPRKKSAAWNKRSQGQGQAEVT